MRLICLFILIMEMFNVGEVSNPPFAKEMYLNSGRRQSNFKKANFDLGNQHETDKKIIIMMWDLIRDTRRRIRGVIKLRIQEQEKAPFEIGYIAATLQDKYRKMVELYNNSWTFRKQILMMDAIVMSGELQTLYFETEHLINMMHEVERKYALITSWNEQYGNVRTRKRKKIFSTSKRRKKRTSPTTMAAIDADNFLDFQKKKEYVNLDREEVVKAWNYRYGTTLGHLVSPRPFARWRPKHYGWEVHYDWYDYNQMYQSPRKLYPPFHHLIRNAQYYFG